MLPQSTSRRAALALARRSCAQTRAQLSPRRLNSTEPAGPSPAAPSSSLPVRTQADLAPSPPPRQNEIGQAKTIKNKTKVVDPIQKRKWQIRRIGMYGWLLCVLPVGVFTYMCYELDKLFTTWPEEMRQPLRLALKNERLEHWENAEICWREAYDLARTADVRPKLTLMQLTGIATSYVDLLLTHAVAPQRARPILISALAEIDAYSTPLSPSERQRRVAILSKLGEVAEKLKRPDEEEKYLTMALQDALKGVIEVRRLARKNFVEKRTDALEDLPTPTWVSGADIAICCENLAAYYVRTGNGDYANALYLHAINTILPPTPPGSESDPKAPEPTLDEVCRGAHLMTNLANSLIIHPSTENIRLAGVWAKKGIQAVNAGQDSIEMATLRGTSELTVQQEETKRTCDRVKSVALFNMGIIASMNRQFDEAKMFLTESSLHSAKIGYYAGRTKAEVAREKVVGLGHIEEQRRVKELFAGKL